MSQTTSFAPRLAALAGAVALMLAGSAGATSLLQAYDAALQNDPTFRSARHENEAGQENRILGRSALLPTVQASYSNSKVRADISTVYGSGTGQPATHPEYLSRSAVVQLRQPVINLDGVARYRQGIAQTNYADAQFDFRKQDLILRLSSAYTDALFASTQLRLAEVQRDVYSEQQSVNNRMFEKGEGTKTDMLETQARLDLAEAQVLEAKDNVATTRATLAGITGLEVEVLDDVKDDFRIAPAAGMSFAEWREIAIKQNPELVAQQFTIESARQEVNKNRAGHAPRLDFIASYSKSTSDSINTYTQESTQRAVGIQLTVPLYSGGSVSAATRQAVANQEKAKSDLEAYTDKVLIELRKQHATVQSSVARVRALDKAVASGTELVKATEQSIKGGVRINLDLLNAQQQLYTSKRDQAQARYNYLLAMLRLNAAAGTLDIDTLREVAAYFK
ncbi:MULTISPECIES: TolC family outer membrane protein [unclassified Duganella]|uniref:TolC family outer membrane protein n=1 Tax=unclassified Duganella TaxID=2636909 RepID=UPI00088C2B19|nr:MULTISPECIES: TolC family outer membrane protein [unclassified Duganella]SDF93521.1 outer membrane protein, protease secretion system [Duganella sp. OV458]SDJ11307.1 outer membrane protein, protease secretion system [Duganella sp. OV510]